ncbi:hypothetical protein PUR71_28025 [Streptomyces sp. SP17BM10]|uniref:hypothetical protein n=1 Tax=Streptomyces sp. SP17BM10 TaxID=3002530 RepID=UPI002E78F850|nr:hypothetical protein [Streptomyces sp. SP17BM10]MEE1786721.1 hypothetical protein [Streptomyces sp. SP17BM10]
MALARTLPLRHVRGPDGRFDQQLNLLHAQELPLVEGLPGGGNLAGSRQTLRQILLFGPEKSVRPGCRFTHDRTNPSGTVTAHVADGTGATGDVLVGADEGNSAVGREYLRRARVVDGGPRLLYGKAPLVGDETRSCSWPDSGPVHRGRTGPAPGRRASVPRYPAGRGRKWRSRS